MKHLIAIKSAAAVMVAITTCALAPLGSAAETTPLHDGTAKADAQAGKQSPPPGMPPRPLQLPKPLIYKMDNGLKVVLLEDHRVPFVTFQLGIKSGDANDPPGMTGLSEITSSELMQGTQSRTDKQIASQVDQIGGALRVNSDDDFTIMSGSVLAKNQDQLFDLMSDVLLHPSFPEEELKLEKTNLLQELAMKRSNPGFLADERFHKVVFGDHPYAVVAPTPESVEKIARADVQRFHKEHYLPNISSLVVVGDFQTDKLRALLDKDLGSWQSGTAPVVNYATPPQRNGQTIYLVDRPGSVQSSVRIGNIGLQRRNPDFFAAMVANQVLGGSANSRLFLNIREQKGYTYGAYSSFQARLQPGLFTASADVRSPVTGPSLKEFLYELNRIRSDGITDAEMTAAKNFLIGSFQIGFETQSSISQKLLEVQLYNMPENSLATFTTKVEAVTPADVQRVARKYINFDNLAITVVGDAKQIEPDLRTFAPVEVYDQSGKLLRTDAQLPSKSG